MVQRLTLGLLAGRGIQLLLSIALLGITLSLARRVHRGKSFCSDLSANEKHQVCNLGRLPSSSYFAAFTGVWTILDALVGSLGAVVSFVPWTVVLAGDALALVFCVAAGINLAVLRTKFDTCGDVCSRWTATIAFEFLVVIVTMVAVLLVLMKKRAAGAKGVSKV